MRLIDRLIIPPVAKGHYSIFLLGVIIITQVLSMRLATLSL